MKTKPCSEAADRSCWGAWGLVGEMFITGIWAEGFDIVGSGDGVYVFGYYVWWVGEVGEVRSVDVAALISYFELRAALGLLYFLLMA